MYIRRTVPKYKYHAALVAMVLAITIIILLVIKDAYIRSNTIISPLGMGYVVYANEIREIQAQNLDTWVDKYAEKYATPKLTKSKLKYQLHCLLYYESGHYATNKCGDSGLACGAMQYHQATWAGFRNIMLKRELITEIGDRFNLEQAIETTAWAIADGREYNWGPILRGKCQ